MGEMLVPPWLESLLSASFFTICSKHNRTECNMFCLDCMNINSNIINTNNNNNNNIAFCSYCRSSDHQDHYVIQIRRSSYHDVVRVSEIQKVMDISEVQTYVINSARVLFLNERPQPKGTTPKGSVSYLCETCRRSLLDPFRFCSLGCKLVGIKKNGDASFVLSIKNEEEGVIGRRMASKEGGELREECNDNDNKATPPPTHSNSRRRKGTPHRAPFGT